MKYFKADAHNTIIFEDSEVGIQAGEKTGAMIFVVKNFKVNS